MSFSRVDDHVAMVNAVVKSVCIGQAKGSIQEWPEHQRVCWTVLQSPLNLSDIYAMHFCITQCCVFCLHYNLGLGTHVSHVVVCRIVHRV